MDGSAGEGGVHRLRLLASAIAGTTLGIADAGPGERAWTDGTTVFVDAHAHPTDQVRMVAVQASLLAAGSLAPGVVRQLVRRPALARRYLAVEGHRALVANEELLPGPVRSLIDPDPGTGVGSSASTPAIARGSETSAGAVDGDLAVVGDPGWADVAAGRASEITGERGMRVRPAADDSPIGRELPSDGFEGERSATVRAGRSAGSAVGAAELAGEPEMSVGAAGDPLAIVREWGGGAAAAETSLAVARSRQAIDDPPDAFGVIRPRRLLAALERADTTALAAGEGRRPRPHEVRPGLETLDEEAADDEDARHVGHLLSSPVGGRGPLGRLLRWMLRPTRQPGGGGPPGAEAATHIGRARSPSRGPSSPSAGAPSSAPDAAAAFEPRASTYPEWDVRRRRYRPDWCTVRERDPRPEDLAPMPMPDGRALRRPLARLGTELTRVRRRPQGDDIDIDAAVEARVATLLGSAGDPVDGGAPGGPQVEAVAGSPPGPGRDVTTVGEARVATRLGWATGGTADADADAGGRPRVEARAGSGLDDAVYVESLRRRRDLAVLVLLDVSGSAAERGPAGRTVHEHQRSAAGALTAALHDLGDRVALYAFNSQGRRAVRVVRVKGFDDRLDSRVARRLGGLVPGAYTRLGAAIRHGARTLEEQGGTSRRLLLVLSDGFAYDHGYERAYGEADARRALGEVRRRGVGCLCLSVGAGTDPVALRRVFGTAAHAMVPDPDLLAGVIGPLFRTALRSAEAQRRAFQGQDRIGRHRAVGRRTG